MIAAPASDQNHRVMAVEKRNKRGRDDTLTVHTMTRRDHTQNRLTTITDRITWAQKVGFFFYFFRLYILILIRIGCGKI